MMKLALALAAVSTLAANAQIQTESGSQPVGTILISTTSGASINDVFSTSSIVASANPVPSMNDNPDTEATTATPSITADLTDPIPSQADLPPKQAWCPSEIFCAGEILQTINIAMPYADSKTIVDKPTNGTANATIAAFNAYGNDITYGDVVDFLEESFKGEGLELAPTNITGFPTDPVAFRGIPDPYVKGFTLTVHNIWPLLVRDTNESRLCENGECESSLIPLNHTFVVPGGRFREQYYWDSKFILEGLLKSELYEEANSTLHNFMDEIEQFGFIPNGGRIYYLNRSQPPVFIGMVLSYYNATRDGATLSRAFPIMEKELEWWDTNRSINITSPYSNRTRHVYHYSVTNSAPRPESYLEDYEAANGPDIDPPYTEKQKADLYAELASGAETGWDYSSRWAKNPHGGNEANQNPTLRTLNVRNTTAIDLNSILYKAHIDLATLYDMNAATLAKYVRRRGPSDRASYHRSAAETLKTAILDLFWDEEKLAFYDFNMTSNARNEQFTAAHWYPLWAGIIPDVLTRNETAAFGAFSSLNLVMRRYNGTIPATFITTGLQWDFPNAWPPHIYFALEALGNIPNNVSTSSLPESPGNNSWNLLPQNQLGLSEQDLPLQTLTEDNTVDVGADLNAENGTVFNGGNATEGEGWVKQLQREIANRYVASVYCSWYATGGSIPGLLPRLPNSTLIITDSIDQDGHLFEKFSALDVDSAGRGGEYAVQAGFGWTNGVLLWVTSEFKDLLVRPTCPEIVLPVGAEPNSALGTVLRFSWMTQLMVGLISLASLIL